ncbi:hypothetical protein D3C76_1640630 [compost metagenome]
MLSVAAGALRSARRSEKAPRAPRPKPLALTGVSESTGWACTRLINGSLSSRPNAWVSNGVAKSSDVETA